MRMGGAPVSILTGFVTAIMTVLTELMKPHAQLAVCSWVLTYEIYSRYLGDNPKIFADCFGDEFTCKDGTCIFGYWVCDQVPHCQDGEDELGCSLSTCRFHVMPDHFNQETNIPLMKTFSVTTEPTSAYHTHVTQIRIVKMGKMNMIVTTMVSCHRKKHSRISTSNTCHHFRIWVCQWLCYFQGHGMWWKKRLHV